MTLTWFFCIFVFCGVISFFTILLALYVPPCNKFWRGEVRWNGKHVKILNNWMSLPTTWFAPLTSGWSLRDIIIYTLHTLWKEKPRHSRRNPRKAPRHSRRLDNSLVHVGGCVGECAQLQLKSSTACCFFTPPSLQRFACETFPLELTAWQHISYFGEWMDWGRGIES